MANYSIISAYSASRATEAAIEAIEAEARANIIALEAKTEAKLPGFFANLSQLIIDTAQEGRDHIWIHVYDVNNYDPDEEYKRNSASFSFPGLLTERIRKNITHTLVEAGYNLKFRGYSNEEQYGIRISWKNLEDEGV